jgi:hypothetical protein
MLRNQLGDRADSIPSRTAACRRFAVRRCHLAIDGAGYRLPLVTGDASKLEQFYSQFGEDRYLAEHQRVPERGVFVDVGAGDPVRFSNSFYFEQLGWTGICIDADPKQVEALRGSRSCGVEWAAVTSAGGDVELLQCDDPDYSATLTHLPEVAAARGWGYVTIRVPGARLETILEEHGIERITLLSVDTEGTDSKFATRWTGEDIDPPSSSSSTQPSGASPKRQRSATTSPGCRIASSIGRRATLSSLRQDFLVCRVCFAGIRSSARNQ